MLKKPWCYILKKYFLIFFINKETDSASEQNWYLKFSRRLKQIVVLIFIEEER